MKKRILTGDRPSGKLHLGHYVGSLQNRVQLQSTYDQFIMVADVQALTDNFDQPEKITSHVMEVVKDYISVGIDPAQSTIFVQSQIPQLTELTVYYLNLVSLGRLERNPTVKVEIQQKGYGDSIPAGFFCYPVSQAADITAFEAELVPVGADQIPMIEQTNEVVRKFNRLYGDDCLKECTYLLGSTSRLMGIDGKAKASKSLNNTIFLSDEPDVIKQKVFQMYTDPNHLKVSDPGQIEGNVVFSYLDAFHPDKDQVQSLKDHYQRGGLGDMTIKKRLNESLQTFLTPIREKRQSLSDDYVRDVLKTGTQHAKTVAEHTTSKVRDAIGLNYFS
jgi:tryptophanyl-tRNA synthetase